MILKNTFQLTPVRLSVATFLGLILFGSLLLMLPISTKSTEQISFIDALFTATSAVCVTGLAVQDTASYFSTFGQCIILFLIQTGGLGIMTLYASLPVFFGQQIQLTQRRMFSSIFEADNYESLKETIKSIIKYTLVIEIFGALILAARFYTLWGDWKKSLYHGIFHSISAFCNAGFMLFSNGLNSFRSDFVINIVIMMLIILGGIGFIVLFQIKNHKTYKKLSASVKLALAVSTVCIVGPSLFIFYFEFNNALAGMGLFEKLLVTTFQVVTARTAGFNTIDMIDFSSATLFLICILMFVGASPGGTGGGVKTTTIGLMILSIRSIFRKHANIQCYGRTVPDDVVTRAVALLSIAILAIIMSLIVLLLLEDFGFLETLFEVVSAFGTVGLSMGVTPLLSVSGKIMICCLMFVGRIGTLSLVFLLGTNDQRVTHQYPLGKFMVG